MKTMRATIVLIVLAGTLLLSSCDAYEAKTMKSEQKEGQNMALKEKRDLVFRELCFKREDFDYSNTVPFSYDDRSELTIESFGEVIEDGDRFPITVIRFNKGVCYTVLSLKDRKLAYIVFGELSGKNFFYVKDIVEYPYSSLQEEQQLSFLLSKDLPEAILKSESQHTT